MRSDLLREAPTNRSQSPFLFTAKGQEGEGATFLFDNKWKSYPFRAFFNYITGGAKAPPAPMVAPPLNHFGPPSQSPFSLKYKQNMEFRREV